MVYQNILLETNDRISILTINRPDKRNALNQATRDEILHALDTLQATPDSRVLVITGAGDKAFIAGADISEFEGKTAITQREAMKGRRAFDAVEDFPKPVIAMINGFCLGGGMELAMACDLRIASDNAKFGQPEINLGIIPGGGGTQRLTRLIGEGKSMELILTGDLIDAAEAKVLGLLNDVVPAGGIEIPCHESCGPDRGKEPDSASHGQGGGEDRGARQSTRGPRSRDGSFRADLQQRRQRRRSEGIPAKTQARVQRPMIRERNTRSTKGTRKIR